MKINTSISERVTQMIEYVGLNANEFARKLNYNRSQAIYDIVNGKSKPSFDFFEKLQNSEFSELFDLPWVITGNGEMIKKHHSHLIADPLGTYSKQPQVITVDSHQRDNIALVPYTLKAGYLSGFDNPDFIKKLPSYRMPGITNGIFRMFEVEGNSMFPTLPNKSYVVCQFVENWITDIKDNRLYAIISNEIEDGLVKRCINRIEKYNNLICKSDNRHNYPTQNIDPSSVKEIWEVKLHLNFDLPDPASIYEKIFDLEADMQELKKKLS